MPLLVVHETGYGNAERIDRAIGGAFDGQGDVRAAALREAAGLDRAGPHGLPTVSRDGGTTVVGTTVGEERNQR